MLLLCLEEAGDDYTDLADPVTVTFSVPVTPGPPTDSECITIDILDDDALEGDHEFTVMITATSDNAPVDSASSTTTITISDNEGWAIEHHCIATERISNIAAAFVTVF